ncbi:hypothetical protein [Photobacterium sanguinicancri]|uniref:hypothetical protein n=1 Tax=Photobacterium sanguinicancri TaxID=875932 RepID=UPI002480F469|nr:hypothetical protein [Photobacterium sanguinicancri]
MDWSSSIRLYGLLLVCYSSIAILATYGCLKYFFVDRKFGHSTLLNNKFTLDKFNIDVIQYILFFTSAFGFIYILLNSPSWPMLDAIKGYSNEALSGRISFRNDFKGSDFIKNLLAFSGSSLYFYISLSRKLIRSDGRMHLLISILLVVLIYTFNSQKGAVLNVSIGALIVFCMVKGKISIKRFSLLFVAGVSSIFILFSVVKGIPLSIFLESGSRLIIGRIFLGNIEGLFNSLALFPDVINENSSLVGIPSIIQYAILGHVQEPSKLLLMKYFDIDGVLNGTSGFITSYFMAEAWANYNLVGLLFAPIIVGVNFFLVDYIVYRNGKNVLTIAFYAVMYLQFQLHGEFVGFLYFKYFLYFLVSIIPVLSIYIVFKSANVIKRS